MKRRILNLNIVFIFMLALLANCCLPQFVNAESESSKAHSCCQKTTATTSHESHCDGHCFRAVVDSSRATEAVNSSSQQDVVKSPVNLSATYYLSKPLQSWLSPPEKTQQLSSVHSQHFILRL